MYFLNGDRIYVKPEKSCGTLNEQLENCLAQLAAKQSEGQIFKLNFFVETSSREEYLKLRNSIPAKVAAFLPGTVLQSIISQPPLTCKVIVEANYFKPDEWEMEIIGDVTNGVAHFKNPNAEVLIGNVQSEQNLACRLNTENAFKELIVLFNKAFFPLNSIVRQWNYIENILAYDGGKQRYQEFNDVRSGVYGNTFNKNGYPSATGIGMQQGGVIIEFVAIKSPLLVSLPIDNPSQVSAHNYSTDVLVGNSDVQKTTPKFERARYLELFGRRMIFISGTASILGESTTDPGDAQKQTEITIQNISRLYSAETLEMLDAENKTPRYSHARVYVKNRKDFATIRKTVKAHYGDLPVVYIIADICRDNLLVEIEGKVVLE